jgi:hypothetical protein
LGTSSFWQALRVARVVTSAGEAERQFRLLGISGILLAVSGIGSVALVAALGAADAADIVALRVMAYGCWLYGGLGLFHLMSPDALRDEPNELCRLRGIDTRSPWLRAVAFSRRLSLGMCLAGLPGIAATLFVSREAPTFVQRLSLLGVCFFYLVSLSVVLGGLGAIATRAAPRAPRTFAAGLVLIPALLSVAYGGVPNIVGVYSWGLGELIAWGGVSR